MPADPRLQVFPRAFAVCGGGVFVASLLFFAWQYAVGFDQRPAGSSASAAVLWNVGLFTVFAAHHSIFARLGIKAWIRRVAPPSLERSIYVWISSLLFIGVCAWWRAVPLDVWRVTGAAAAAVMGAAQAAGGIFAVLSARALDVFTLAGIRQTFETDARSPSMHVIDRGPYGWVRHPIYLGWLAAVWFAPHMTGARLVFATVSCVYLLLAVPFEERDLRRVFGPAYDNYMRKVRWKVIPGVF